MQLLGAHDVAELVQAAGQGFGTAVEPVQAAVHRLGTALEPVQVAWLDTFVGLIVLFSGCRRLLKLGLTSTLHNYGVDNMQAFCMTAEAGHSLLTLP